MRWRLTGLAVLALVLAACDRSPSAPPSPPSTSAATPEAGPPLLRDATAESGIKFTYRNGEEANRYTILETVGGGVALLDFDGDGRLDVYLAGGGEFLGQDNARHRGLPGKLYRNLGGCRFADVTSDVGLDIAPFYSHGCLAGDFDNDGWPDLLLTGFGGMVLLRNEPHGAEQRRFVDVTRPWGLVDERWCTSAAWGDLMGQGRADLYVCRYLDWSLDNDPVCTRRDDPQQRDVCPPQRFQPLPHAIYRQTDGTYQDISDRVGMARGKGLGVVLVDVNDDGRPDVYVANDDSPNHLYLNRGGGKLEERGMTAGVAQDDEGFYNGSMGVDVGDFDGSGRCSIFVTNFQGELPALYGNLGDDGFLHQSRAAGLGAVGREFVGFGTALFDLENDGWLDIAIVNGHVLRYPVGSTFRQRSLLFHNVEHQGRRFFREISSRGGPCFATPILGRGLAAGDLDNDGWTDLVVSACNTPVAVLRNVASQSSSAHWIGLELAGRGHRPIAGATVRITVAGRQLTRYAKSGGSYLSTSDPRILVGLAATDRLDKLTVRWPWGELQEWDARDLAVDRYWRLEEGETTVRPALAPRDSEP